jgi:hypothetical protein
MTATAQDEGCCQNYRTDLEFATLPDSRRAMSLRKRWWRLKRSLWYARVWGPVGYLKRVSSSGAKVKHISVHDPHETGTPMANATDGTLDLQPGDLVEVRSEKEILDTLDGEGKLRGLRFTTEMRPFCGKQFTVYKRVRKICIETTGEIRTIKWPTVILEGVICDGSAHNGCDRSCFHFWREEWLRRASSQAAVMNPGIARPELVQASS